jgi:hypothetical protein
VIAVLLHDHARADRLASIIETIVRDGAEGEDIALVDDVLAQLRNGRDRFTLAIELGNEAMQTPQDVAGALRRVADTVGGSTARLVDSQHVRDRNGNTVGSWTLS